MSERSMDGEVSDRTRRIVGLITLVVVVAIVAVLIFLLRPRGGDTVSIPVDSLTPGSVVYYSTKGFFIVRDGDEFVALSDQDPGAGCRVTWRPDVAIGTMTGAFRSACSGRTFDRRGRPQDAGAALQQLPVEQTSDNVIVQAGPAGDG